MITSEEFYTELKHLFEENDNEKLERYYDEILEVCGIPGVLREKETKSTPDENAERREREGCKAEKGDEVLTALRVAVLNETASHYRGRSDWNKCIPLYRRLMEELERAHLEETQNYGIARLNRGTAYRFMGDLDHAIADFNEAGRIFEKTDCRDVYLLASFHNNRAPVFAAKGDYLKAAGELKKALDYLEQMRGTEQERAIALAAIAQMLYRLGELKPEEQPALLKEAEEYADRAMNIYHQAGEGPHTGSILSAKALCCAKRGERKKAAELFRTAAEITKKYFGENVEYRICMRNAEELS